jgi:hypothetical protein
LGRRFGATTRGSAGTDGTISSGSVARKVEGWFVASPLTGSVEEVPSDVEPPKGELCSTKPLRGCTASSRTVPDVAANEKLDEELLDELVTGGGGEKVRSTASTVGSFAALSPAVNTGFLLTLVLEAIAVISIAFCLL